MGPRILEQHAITFDRSADLRHARSPLLAAACAPRASPALHVRALRLTLYYCRC